jgi:hypothetical protein
MKIEIREIQIPRGAKIGPEQKPIYGYETVKASCMGGLAVHKALPGSTAKWEVTHIASGMKMGPICAATKSRAIQNMKAALAVGFDWTKSEEETLKAIRESRVIADVMLEIGR